MKVLIISNMYPSSQKPYAGIFVKNQVEWLRESCSDSVLFEVCAMERRFTGILGSFRKYSSFVLSLVPRLFVQYNVVHLHFFVPLGLFVWLYKRLHPETRVVVTFHGNDLLGPRYRGSLKPVWRYLSAAVDVAISVGPEIKSIVDSDLKCGTNVLLPAGIDEDIFYKVPAVNKNFDFIFVGSLIKRKGIDLVIRLVKEMRINARWYIVGTGECEGKIQELANDGLVTYKKVLTQSEMRMVINESKWLVAPSRKEPFGLVVTEALFCGTPVICSDDHGFQMQIENGKNGFMVKAGDYDSLAAVVSKAVVIGDAEYETFASAALCSNKQFSRESVVERLIQIYSGSGERP